MPADEVLLQFQAAPLTGDLLVHVTPTTSEPPPGAGPHNIARPAAPQPAVLPAPARPSAQPFAKLARAPRRPAARRLDLPLPRRRPNLTSPPRPLTPVHLKR